MNNRKIFPMKTNRFALIALLIFAGTAPAFSGATFTPTGAIDMVPTSISDDGTIVVGSTLFGSPTFYYTEAGGAVIIGDGCGSGVPAISGDGSTIVGCHVDANGKENAAKWLGGTSWQDLGSEAGAVPCDAFLSGSWGVNQDGSLAVGLLWRAQVCHANAGFWDLINGGPATVLPTLLDGPATRANAVNGSGNVIVGWQDQATGERTAAKWVDSGTGYVEELILTPSGGFNGEALAVSADGRTIVGLGYDFGSAAWIWHEGDGVMPIEPEAGVGPNRSALAVDVSDNGRIVVGFVRQGFFLDLQRAFIWRYGKGVVFLDNFIKRRGAVVPAGWTLNTASVISSDGRTIYGWGFNPNGQIEMYKVVLN
jgi:uncharacterized membrane protein